MTQISAILALAFVARLNAACSRTGKPVSLAGCSANSPVQEPSVSPREVLANQPNFMAEELYSSFERWHGHSFMMEVAKKGEWYRHDTDMVAVFSTPTESNIRYFLKAKMFDLPPINTGTHIWRENADNAAIFAQEEGVNFEIDGEEVVEGHEWIKIKATKQNATESDVDSRAEVYLYAAKDLQHLVIKTEVLLPERRTSYLFRNVSFDVPDDLLKVLARRPVKSSNKRFNRRVN